MKIQKIKSAPSQNGLGKFPGRPMGGNEMGISKIMAAHRAKKHAEKVATIAEGVALGEQMKNGRISLY